MIKLAIFVEGQTESLFVNKLFREISGRKNIEIQNQSLTGNLEMGRSLNEIEAASKVENKKYFVMIVNCEADNRVASAIKENYQQLTAKGFSFIVGMRDVYPDFAPSEVAELRTGLMYRMPTSPTEVLFILGVMEIETWFVAECSHFEKIDPKLTPSLIMEKMNINPCDDDIQKRKNPAKDLDEMYGLVGKAYTKKRSNTLRTIDCIDYARMYVETSEKIYDLKRLVECIDSFLS